MSLPNYLSSIEASGMYRFIFDKSQAPAEELRTLRLVVGYSDKGPFNTPVYVESVADFKKIFGDISKKLERKGIFFHRLALQCLDYSPILCLNLKDLDETEKVQGISFNSGSALGEAINVEVSKIYNTNRFWTLEPEKLNGLEGTIGDATPATFNKYINIAATDEKGTSNTIFVRSYVPTGYNITFADWYSQNTNGEEIPDYLLGHENERVQDYFAEVYVFKGEFTPALASSETMNAYFKVENGVVKLNTELTNAFGDPVDVLQALSEDSNSNFINKYTGIVLPEFKDSTNTIISLDAEFNLDNSKHKMMMFLNQDLLWDEEISILDLNTTGYNLIEEINAEEKTIPAQEAVTRQAVYVAEFEKVQTGTTPEVPESYNTAVYNVTDGKDVTTEGGIASGVSAAIKKYAAENNLSEAEAEAAIKEAAKNSEVGFSVNFTNTTSGKEYIVTWTYVPAVPETPIYDIEIAKITREEDPIAEGTPEYEAAFAKVNIPSVEAFDGGETEQTWEGEGEADTIVVTPAQPERVVTAGVKVAEGSQLLSNKSLNPTYNVANWNEEESAWEFDSELAAKDSEPSVLIYNGIDTLEAGDDNLFELPENLKSITLSIGDKVFANGEVIILSTIKTKDIKDEEGNITETKKFIGFVDSTGEAYSESIEGQFNILNHSLGDKIYDDFEVTYLKGYTYNGGYDDFVAAKGYTKGSQWSKLQWHKSILSVLNKWKGLRIALTNRVDSDWRYLVDTFDSYVEEGVHGELAVLSKTKQNSLGILNYPSVATLSKCEYTSFTDGDGLFQVKYIKTGGNRQKKMSVKLALPTEINGAAFNGFFTQVVIRENGVKKTIPSAGLVSNLFMQKLDERYAYSFVAGPNYGRLSADNLVGPEFNFDKEELGILETNGINAIVFVPQQGTYINSNRTAKHTPKSALSYINVIEMSIYLQDEIEKMLQSYQWEYNTAELRGTVKGKADKICEIIQKNGGLVRYFNQCDEYNNTEDVINNEMFIIDTSVEPGMGCGKMVQTLTIYRQGGMKAVFGE